MVMEDGVMPNDRLQMANDDFVGQCRCGGTSMMQLETVQLRAVVGDPGWDMGSFAHQN